MLTLCSPSEELSNCPPQRLHHFAFPLIIYRGSDFSTSSPILTRLVPDLVVPATLLQDWEESRCGSVYTSLMTSNVQHLLIHYLAGLFQREWENGAHRLAGWVLRMPKVVINPYCDCLLPLLTSFYSSTKILKLRKNCYFAYLHFISRLKKQTGKESELEKRKYFSACFLMHFFVPSAKSPPSSLLPCASPRGAKISPPGLMAASQQLSDLLSWQRYQECVQQLQVLIKVLSEFLIFQALYWFWTPKKMYWTYSLFNKFIRHIL